MGWIEDTLRDLARRRSALAAPPPGENGPQPTGPIGQPTGGGLGGAVMGPQGGPEADSHARTYGLVDAYQAYLKRSGRTQDPLLDAVQTKRLPGGQTRMSERTPARLLGDPANPFQVNKTKNAREGLTFQSYAVPGGKVNVYYTPSGKRIPVFVRKRTGPAKGR
jgi:hypothetical protein